VAREDRDPLCLEPAGECAGARNAVNRQDGGVRRRRRIVARELIGLLNVKRTRILAGLYVLVTSPPITPAETPRMLCGERSTSASRSRDTMVHGASSFLTSYTTSMPSEQRFN